MVALVMRQLAGSSSSRRLTSSSGLLAMASLVSYFSGGGRGMAAAARAPPLLFQSPLVTAEQVCRWGGCVVCLGLLLCLLSEEYPC